VILEQSHNKSERERAVEKEISVALDLSAVLWIQVDRVSVESKRGIPKQQCWRRDKSMAERRGILGYVDG